MSPFVRLARVNLPLAGLLKKKKRDAIWDYQSE